MSHCTRILLLGLALHFDVEGERAGLAQVDSSVSAVAGALRGELAVAVFEVADG